MIIDKIKNREELAKYFNELGFKIGAEIGVLGGDYSKLLCDAIPGLKLYCVDSWGFGERKRKEYHLREKERAKINLAPYNATLIHQFSMDAVKDFEDSSLDFVYIDANHQPQFVRDDINEWSKKVRKGGIVSGHDYQDRIKELVDDHVETNHLSLCVTMTESDKALSWWFIK